MLTSGVLSRVRQMALEIHPVIGQMCAHYTILHRLEESGWRRWYFRFNYYNLRSTPKGIRSGCYEMVYINTKFLQGWKEKGTGQ